MKCPCILKTDLNIDSPTLHSIEHDHVGTRGEWKHGFCSKNSKNYEGKCQNIQRRTLSQIFSSAILNVPESEI